MQTHQEPNQSLVVSKVVNVEVRPSDDLPFPIPGVTSGILYERPRVRHVRLNFMPFGIERTDIVKTIYRAAPDFDLHFSSSLVQFDLNILESLLTITSLPSNNIDLSWRHSPLLPQIHRRLAEGIDHLFAREPTFFPVAIRGPR